ncbi:nucleoside triphosphate pyrophosphohydrolase [Flavitalea sp. BT771]|uniref:nucleoside triphosphate pyrophosphohydrolase n=1 Tax=Flavitalea sp. BT771 TaxID=3063329 RepID=UPI0026E2F09A|nr:nucleoside triphosphate pyrophosphohydrolase [Flavitalea sp. BT771]MDO6430876.1 nucleoside triphosphate pyrophosphohydrolase [Flavitalea sp. BT771]MDV6218984.1 nucleoside triphosphate pyrophosphohydrolase [Flavitalea sp. BT771]
MSEQQGSFQRLVTIMDELREKCPWDRKQTVETLRPLTIEETYELADAITSGDWKGIREELGDLLLHIVFYARIGKEQGQFTLEEVIDGICEKLIARHPHIYGDVAGQKGLVEVKDEEDVKQNWEKLKLKEGKRSVLGGVPVSLPATVKAIRLQEKAGQVGFEWDETSQVWDKVKEEMEELQEAVALKDKARIQEEYGDLVFSLVNYARFLQIDAENSLELTNRKFISRFTRMEQEALAQGKQLADMTLEEMDGIWNSIKKQNKTD